MYFLESVLSAVTHRDSQGTLPEAVSWWGQQRAIDPELAGAPERGGLCVTISHSSGKMNKRQGRSRGDTHSHTGPHAFLTPLLASPQGHLTRRFEERKREEKTETTPTWICLRGSSPFMPLSQP